MWTTVSFNAFLSIRVLCITFVMASLAMLLSIVLLWTVLNARHTFLGKTLLLPTKVVARTECTVVLELVSRVVHVCRHWLYKCKPVHVSESCAESKNTDKQRHNDDHQQRQTYNEAQRHQLMTNVIHWQSF